jgi:hypothetical protein
MKSMKKTQDGARAAERLGLRDHRLGRGWKGWEEEGKTNNRMERLGRGRKGWEEDDKPRMRTERLKEDQKAG